MVVKSLAFAERSSFGLDIERLREKSLKIYKNLTKCNSKQIAKTLRHLEKFLAQVLLCSTVLSDPLTAFIAFIYPLHTNLWWHFICDPPCIIKETCLINFHSFNEFRRNQLNKSLLCLIVPLCNNDNMRTWCRRVLDFCI